jgi:predicted transcriptional regulator
MVNNVGQWKYIPGTPEEKKCDMDLVADWISSQNYTIKTSLENLVVMILLHYYRELNDSGRYYYTVEKNSTMINVQDVAAYVSDMGGLQEFDYEM